MISLSGITRRGGTGNRRRQAPEIISGLYTRGKTVEVVDRLMPDGGPSTARPHRQEQNGGAISLLAHRRRRERATRVWHPRGRRRRSPSRKGQEAGSHSVVPGSSQGRLLEDGRLVRWACVVWVVVLDGSGKGAPRRRRAGQQPRPSSLRHGPARFSLEILNPCD